jgi:hypothetical protein
MHFSTSLHASLRAAYTQVCVRTGRNLPRSPVGVVNVGDAGKDRGRRAGIEKGGTMAKRSAPAMADADLFNSHSRTGNADSQG